MSLLTGKRHGIVMPLTYWWRPFISAIKSSNDFDTVSGTRSRISTRQFTHSASRRKSHAMPRWYLSLPPCGWQCVIEIVVKLARLAYFALKAFVLRWYKAYHYKYGKRCISSLKARAHLTKYTCRQHLRLFMPISNEEMLVRVYVYRGLIIWHFN